MTSISFNYAYNSFKNDVSVQENHVPYYQVSDYDIEMIERGKNAITFIEKNLIKGDAPKINHYFYSLVYFNDFVSFWFEYIQYSKKELKQFIVEQIKLSYSHITDYLETKQKTSKSLFLKNSEVTNLKISWP